MHAGDRRRRRRARPSRARPGRRRGPSFVAPTPTPAPFFAISWSTRGDSLNSIADRYGTSARSIAYWSRATYRASTRSPGLPAGPAQGRLDAPRHPGRRSVDEQALPSRAGPGDADAIAESRPGDEIEYDGQRPAEPTIRRARSEPAGVDDPLEEPPGPRLARRPEDLLGRARSRGSGRRRGSRPGRRCRARSPSRGSR